MRRSIAAVVMVLLFANLVSACSRQAPTPAELRAAVVRELAQPNSIWAKPLRPETAASELGRFKQAPVYRASLTYKPKTRELTGTADFLYANRSGHPVTALYLEAAALWASAGEHEFSLSNLQVNGRPAGHTQEKEYVTVPLSQPLAPAENVHLEFSFRTVLPVVVRPTAEQEADVDANWGQYGAIDNQLHGLSGAIPIVVTDTAATEVQFILWDVTINLPAEWEVISSGVSAAPETTQGDRKTTRVVSVSWAFSVFAAWGLQSATQTVDGVRVTVHFPGTAGTVGQEMLEETVQLLRSHVATLGPYPLTKLDVLPLLLSREGRARSGLVTINSRYLTDSPNPVPATVTDPWLRRVRGANGGDIRRQVLAHELAHSWWGVLVWPEADSLVAPSWIEGLTEATGISALERAYGTGAADGRRERQVFQYRVSRAAGVTDIASGKPRPADTSARDYSNMSYYKPAVFYEQVRRLVGDDAWFAAMRKYIEKNRWSVPSDQGPVEELLGNPQVAALYQRWMLETHGDEDIGLFTPDQLKQLGLSK